MPVSAKKKAEIQDERHRFDERVENIREELIWELAVRLDLQEDTVAKIFDET